MLLHDPETDPAMNKLSQAYAFLSASGLARPPADPSIMLYAQPHQVAGLNLDQVPRVSGELGAEIFFGSKGALRAGGHSQVARRGRALH